MLRPLALGEIITRTRRAPDGLGIEGVACVGAASTVRRARSERPRPPAPTAAAEPPSRRRRPGGATSLRVADEPASAEPQATLSRRSTISSRIPEPVHRAFSLSLAEDQPTATADDDVRLIPATRRSSRGSGRRGESVHQHRPRSTRRPGRELRHARGSAGPLHLSVTESRTELSRRACGSVGGQSRGSSSFR